jgi:hypothetical protein
MKERLLIILALIGAVSILIISDFGNSSTVKVYDCSIAEWHPDTPKSIREECRRLRKETLEEYIRESKKSYI